MNMKFMKVEKKKLLTSILNDLLKNCYNDFVYLYAPTLWGGVGGLILDLPLSVWANKWSLVGY